MGTISAMVTGVWWATASFSALMRALTCFSGAAKTTEPSVTPVHSFFVPRSSTPAPHEGSCRMTLS